MDGSTDVGNLEQWLASGYPQSVRTAYLILGNRLDAEDAVQEAYLRAWKFRSSLEDESSFKPWLYRVVVNSCNSKLRTEIPHRDRRSSADHLETVVSNDDLTTRLALSHDVFRAISALPAHLRIVVVLRYYADLSEQEIAIAIGRQPGTVKSRLHEARRRLADHPALRSETSSDPTTTQEAAQ
jgi:RNA polymerase sigma-70 factor (ECF subfamily)